MTHLEHEMQQLKAEILDMSKLVSQQMKDSMLSLAKMDKQLAIETLATEKQVNAMELKIDRSCESIFALYNPVAQDLRLVLAQLRINYNLEKLGDIAASVAKFVKKSFLFDYSSLIEHTHALQMFEEANDLLVDVMTSFEKEDAELAKNILKRDKALNQQNDQARAYIIEQIKKDPEHVEEYLKMLSIVRKLERAGDQSKAIAKEIIFFVEAKIVKHSK
ncbi:MAG: phosphate signaling complex protein PhoU [Bacteroidia bacterium]|nr:phosphate signaling complex protein PhoU [Bacteroidia bacterium]